MEFNPQEILFRCSSIGRLFVEPREKSPKDRLAEAIDKRIQLLRECDEAKNKETKTYANKQEAIRKLELGIAELDKIKDDPFLSETTKVHLLDIFVSAKYGRREEIKSKFLDKGNEREQDSITLLSLEKKDFYKKNTERLSNEYITGEVDVFVGESLKKAVKTTDTKTSWSAHTYYRAITKELDDLYLYQGHGYMALTGAKTHEVAYCLVNGTADAIMNEKYYAARDMGILDAQNTFDETYKEKCRQIEINHIFDLSGFLSDFPHFDMDNDVSTWSWDIPRSKRLYLFSFERDEAVIEQIYEKCRQGRNYIEQLNQTL